jgi:hypothetical protein
LVSLFAAATSNLTGVMDIILLAFFYEVEANWLAAILLPAVLLLLRRGGASHRRWRLAETPL